MLPGICLGHGNVFGNPRPMFDHRHLTKEFFTLRIKVPQVESQCREVQGDLSRMVKNELEAQFQCRCLQEGRQPRILSHQRKFHRILWLYNKDCKYRSFSSIKSPTPSTFSCWKIRFKNPIGCFAVDRRRGDGRFSG